MPIQPTYPGVYVQEEPSGVRTITGVSTSVALFIGRTKQGPLNKPVLCLNYTDFERTFSSDASYSEMPYSVRLFFQNGGTKCYVVRIANGATPSEITLNNKGGSNVLRVIAKWPGLVGNSIRLAVTYNGTHPESTFNLEVFRWDTNNKGQLVKADSELWPRLSMDPNSPRYVESFINQNSQLITIEDQDLGTSIKGYSRSGRPVPINDNTAWKNLVGIASVSDTNKFMISVDDGPFVEIDLSDINFDDWPTGSDLVLGLPTVIENKINNALPSSSKVTVTMEDGPTPEANGEEGNGANGEEGNGANGEEGNGANGEEGNGANGEEGNGANGEETRLLKISSANGNVRINPSSDNDLSKALMLGSAQGGIEESNYAAARPVPNGIVFDIDKLIALASHSQNAFKTIKIGTTDIELTNTLETTNGSNDLFYQDGYDISVNGNCDGVREKWIIISNAINNKRISDSTFKWKAELWGSRLALISVKGDENTTTTLISTNGADVNIGNGGRKYFLENVPFYRLGASGQSPYQNVGGDGSDGSAPTKADYEKAFEVVEKEVDLFNLVILPRDVDHLPEMVASLWGPVSNFCQKKRTFLLMDPPESWTNVKEATDPQNGINSLRNGLVKDYSALFYPRLKIRENGLLFHVGPSGAIAGLMSRIDTARGVWKAPAGTEADIRGVVGLEYRFSDSENGVLNPNAINTLRIFPNGIVNWGARTMDGADDIGSEWKYIPVRRLALYIEESLFRGLKWVVFEPNDEPLWAQIRLNVGAFMHGLFRQGAFQGQKRQDAYFVKCDSETTTQNDINLGIVHIWVGFAPLKPAEFVIIHLQQMAGQLNH